MVFGQNLKNSTLAKKDTIGKGISRGAFWCSFSFIAPSSEELWVRNLTETLSHIRMVKVATAVSIKSNHEHSLLFSAKICSLCTVFVCVTVAGVACSNWTQERHLRLRSEDKRTTITLFMFSTATFIFHQVHTIKLPSLTFLGYCIHMYIALIVYTTGPGWRKILVHHLLIYNEEMQNAQEETDYIRYIQQ